MPTWSSFDAFGRDLAKMAQALSKEDGKRIGMEMGRKAQAIARREASADLGGDPKFSGWEPTLDTKLKPIDSGAILTPTRSGAGPWTVANDGRHASGGVGRFQGPGVNLRTGATTRRNGRITVSTRRRGIRWNGTTSGKGTADRAFEAMNRELPKLAERGVKVAMRRKFDVT